MRDRVLVANRGEIAIRVCRGVRAAGYDPVVIYSRDDQGSLHASAAEYRHSLPGAGPAAYLDIDQVVDSAVTTGCTFVHPGYGFLSENADFARACEAAGLTFVGPSSDVLDLFGDKAAARDLAGKSGVPVVPGKVIDTPADVAAFMKDAGAPVLIKATAGGGGRGIRLVESVDEVDAAFRVCREEALVAFGSGELYVERFLPHVRHIEVQVVADLHGAVIHLWDRDCSIQRNNQKLVEIAPARSVAPGIRKAIWGHSIALANAAGYAGVGTFEFLVWEDDGEEGYAFIEANARLQVEHTVTEMVTGVDLVCAQMQIAAGRPLSSTAAWAAAAAEPSGDAVQLRVNAETLVATGEVNASHGRIETYILPSGPGVRIDGYGYAGYEVNPRFDTLLAKIIAHSPHGGVRSAFDLARHALRETRIDGVRANVDVLWAILTHFLAEPDHLFTRSVDDNRAHLLELAAGYESMAPSHSGAADEARARGPEPVEDSESVWWMRSATSGAVVKLAVGEGDAVRRGAELATVEAMKMEHLVVATVSGIVTSVGIAEGDGVADGQPLIGIEISTDDEESLGDRPPTDLDEIRPDLAEVLERRSRTLDAHRPDAAARRHDAGRLTAREIVSSLCDPGSLQEYGSLVLAARRRTTSVEELLTESPADGIITGTAHVNGDQFGRQAARAVVAVSDYTVYAGTQGILQHDKLGRMIAIAGRTRSPMVLWAEGAGGRGSDTDSLTHTPNTFHDFARLSGRVPLVGVVGGRCFAGNAVLLGCCDVVIATKNSSIGLGGPVMIEGGGFGQVTPDDVGPAASGFASGVVDILVDDDRAAAAVARKYLSYFQGSLDTWTAEDQRCCGTCSPNIARRAMTSAT